MNWRRWNNILHRDVGYALVGLTVIYSISGIAVNHRGDWNPNYALQKQILTIEPARGTSKEEIVVDVMAKLHIQAEELKNSFRPNEETLQLFLEERTYSIDLPTGNVIVDAVHSRPVLYEMNQLHLNTPKGIWTLIADLFAVCLILVAITGMFVLKGKTGILGRGIWFVTAGIVIPVAYWLYYWYS